MEGILFNDFSEIKEHVSAVNGDFSMESINSYIKSSLDEIKIMTGQEVLSDLIEAFDDNSLTAIQEELLEVIRKPLANMAFYKYANAGTLKISDSGFSAEETETTKRPFQWQIRDFKKQCLDDYSAGMVTLWDFLQTNSGDFAAWDSSKEYIWLQQRPINELDEWHKSGRRITNWRTHWTLLPEMQLVWEDLKVEITEELWDTINDELLDGFSSQTENLMPYIQRYVAHATIERAAQTLPVSIDADGILIKEVASSTANSDIIRQENERNTIQKSAKLEASKALCKLLKYLDNNADEFTYSPYYESFLANQEETPKMNDAEDKLIFI